MSFRSGVAWLDCELLYIRILYFTFYSVITGCARQDRLLDRLQLPESERASLAAEEQEIAELQRRLDESDTRYSDLAADNIDLKQEVRDLQLEMEGNTPHRICLFTALRIIVLYVLRAGVSLSVCHKPVLYRNG